MATTSSKTVASVGLTQKHGHRQECLPRPSQVLLEFPPEDRVLLAHLIWRNQHHSFQKDRWKFPDLPGHFENMIAEDTSFLALCLPYLFPFVNGSLGVM